MGCGDDGFCFDNELPRHKAVLAPFTLAKQLVTNKNYLEFISDEGYRDPQWWLADGWAEVNQQQWQAPFYWLQRDGRWFEYTLHGLIPLDLQRPVVHVSAYEADAYARWSNARLATEYELESAANGLETNDDCLGQFIDAGEFHPQVVSNTSQLLGSAWQWTSSAYGPYPGFKAADGAIGEYNGKFMCNQLVLRGGSCFTPRNHLRPSYRNFFYPRDRWQMSAIRLARSL
jgi:ergothioneine biosynthesis protein EgtB